MARHTRTQSEVEWLMDKLEQRSILALELLGVPVKDHCIACGNRLAPEEQCIDNELNWCTACWQDFCKSD